MHAVVQQLSSITVWVHSYTHSQGKVEGNLWVHTQQQQHTHTHTLPMKKLKEICGSTHNNNNNTHTLSQRKERRIQSLEGEILLLLLLMMMMMIIIINLIITQSAAISQSTFCFVLPSFFNMGTPSISKIQLLLLLCLFFLFSFPISFPSLPLLPLASNTTLCPAHRVVQHMALGS